MAQRVVIAWHTAGVLVSDNTEEINGLINEGWTVQSVTPMFGAGPIGPENLQLSIPRQIRFAAIIVLQQ